MSQLSGFPKQGSYITCKEARHHKDSIVPPQTISPLPLLYGTNIGTKAKHIGTKANNIGNYASKGVDTPLPPDLGGLGLVGFIIYGRGYIPQIMMPLLTSQGLTVALR